MTTPRFTDEQVWRAYQETGSVTRALRSLGLKGTVGGGWHERIKRLKDSHALGDVLNAITQRDPIDRDQAQMLLDAYVAASEAAPGVHLIDMGGVDSEYVGWIHACDVHWGHPGCDASKLQRNIEWFVKEHEKKRDKLFWIGGDFFNFDTKSAPGYTREPLSFEHALETAAILVEPLVESGLLKGVFEGNHEERAVKGLKQNIRPSKMFADRIGARFFPSASRFIIKAGAREHTAYVVHGRSAARTAGGRLNALKSYMEQTDADLTIMEHLHSGQSLPLTQYKFDKKKRELREHTRLGVIGRSFLMTAKSYAMPGGYPPALRGVTWIDLPTGAGEMHLRT